MILYETYVLALDRLVWDLQGVVQLSQVTWALLQGTYHLRHLRHLHHHLLHQYFLLL